MKYRVIEGETQSQTNVHTQVSLAVGSGSSIFPVNWRWLNIASLNAESHSFFSLDFLVYIVKGRDGVYRSTASLLAEEGEDAKRYVKVRYLYTERGSYQHIVSS